MTTDVKFSLVLYRIPYMVLSRNHMDLKRAVGRGAQDQEKEIVRGIGTREAVTELAVVKGNIEREVVKGIVVESMRKDIVVTVEVNAGTVREIGKGKGNIVEVVVIDWYSQ